MTISPNTKLGPYEMGYPPAILLPAGSSAPVLVKPGHLFDKQATRFLPECTTRYEVADRPAQKSRHGLERLDREHHKLSSHDISSLNQATYACADREYTTQKTPLVPLLNPLGLR